MHVPLFASGAVVIDPRRGIERCPAVKPGDLEERRLLQQAVPIASGAHLVDEPEHVFEEWLTPTRFQAYHPGIAVGAELSAGFVQRAVGEAGRVQWEMGDRGAIKDLPEDVSLLDHGVHSGRKPLIKEHIGVQKHADAAVLAKRMQQDARLQPENIASIAKIRLIDASDVDDLNAEVCIALRMVSVDDNPVRRRGIGLQGRYAILHFEFDAMLVFPQMRELAMPKIKINKNRERHGSTYLL